MRVQAGGLQALRIPFEHFAGEPRTSGRALADVEERPSPLELIVRACRMTNKYDAFDSTPVKILLTFKWIGFARREFFHDLWWFVAHLTLSTLFIVFSSRRYDAWLGALVDMHSPEVGTNILMLVLWTLTTLVSVLNLVGICGRMRSHLSKLVYFSDPQRLCNVAYNAGQTVVNLLLAVNVCLVNGPTPTARLLAANQTLQALGAAGAAAAAGCDGCESRLYELTRSERAYEQTCGAPLSTLTIADECATFSYNVAPILFLQSLVILLLFVRAVFFFRGFLPFGALVFIVFEVFKQMLPFLCLLAVLTVGFTFATYVLMNHIYPNDEHWTQPARTLFFLLNYGLRFAPPSLQLLGTASEGWEVGWAAPGTRPHRERECHTKRECHMKRECHTTLLVNMDGLPMGWAALA